MAINFPNTPSNGAQHTASGVTWTYDGTTWKADGITSSYSLPTASATVLGGVKVGTGLSISSGVLSSSGNSLSNIADNAQGVAVTGKVATTDGMDIDIGGQLNAAGCSIDFQNTTISFTGASIGGLQGTINGWVDTHLNQSGPTSGHVLSWNGSDYAWVAQSGGSSLAIQDEGNALSTAATTLNFVGAGVTASGTGAVKTITIAGGGGAGSPETTWTMTHDSGNYSFTGNGFVSATTDPTLYLIRGQTYKFVNNTGGHPFRIQTDGPTVGGGNSYNDGVTNQDAGNGVTLTFVVPMDAPDTLYYQCTAHTGMFGTINVLTQGSSSGLISRATVSGTTQSIANNVSDNISIAGYKSYALLSIKPSVAAWVTLYTDAAARTADNNRVQGADPAPDAGVIAEVITTAAATEVKMSPGVIGWNNDATPSTTIYARVVNKSGSAGTISVELKVLKLEA